MERTRLLLGVAGVAIVAYGVVRLVTQVGVGDLAVLALWCAAAVAVHDGVLSPLVLGVGRVLGTVPPRARRWTQAALVAGACVTVVAVPLVLRQGTQPVAKALLLRDYGRDLVVLLVLVAAAALVGWLVDTVTATRPGGGDE